MQPRNDSGLSERRNKGLPIDNLSEFSNVILKHRKIIGYIVGTTFILSIIVSLLLPKMYMATARILPPQQNNTGIASLLSNGNDSLSGLASSLIGNQTPAALYAGIMKSRSVADALNQKFKLKKLYKLKYIEDVYSKLQDRSIIEISKKDHIINVSVRDRDPQRAADMANFYVDMLDRIMRKLNITQGKRKRLFLEDRLKEVRSGLEKAEIELKAFQEKHHLVAIEEQAKMLIEGVAEIKSQIVAAQTKLEVFKQFGTERQVEAVMLKAKIKELKKQLETFEKGENVESGISDPKGRNNASSFYVPLEDMPRLRLQLMRLTRETKVQEKLFELLTAQYEMAQIEEAKDVGTIQVLDPAVAPQKKIGPRRRAIVATSVALALMASVFLAFLMEYTGGWQAISASWPEIGNRLRNLIAALKFRK
jgi:tyrosine-protein kinase Etk/Wzc